MSKALEIPPGKTPSDLKRVGSCLICHIALYTWGDVEKASNICNDGCTHPDDICKNPDCYTERRRTYIGHGEKRRKIKKPCKFPKLSNQPPGMS